MSNKTEFAAAAALACLSIICLHRETHWFGLTLGAACLSLLSVGLIIRHRDVQWSHGHFSDTRHMTSALAYFSSWALLLILGLLALVVIPSNTGRLQW